MKITDLLLSLGQVVKTWEFEMSELKIAGSRPVLVRECYMSKALKGNLKKSSGTGKDGS